MCVPHKLFTKPCHPAGFFYGATRFPFYVKKSRINSTVNNHGVGCG